MKRPGKPRAGRTPLRSMRIADDVWQPAKRRTEAEGTTVTAVVAAYLKRYGAQPPKPPMDGPRK